MGRKCRKEKINFKEVEKNKLEKISRSKKGELREIKRARIILKYNDNKSISRISEEEKTSRETIYKIINRALSIGIDEALKDKYHCPKPPVINQEAKMWVISISCQKPKELGYAQELWTLELLAKHIREKCRSSRYICLQKATKTTIYRILQENPLKPHKIKYYLEKRDPEFEEKMETILITYQEVNAINDGIKKNNKEVVLSLDEKTGIQALQNIAPDLKPIQGKSDCIHRDYEYKRLGTVSFLSGMDLNSGHIFGQVYDRHRSIEFISLLKEIDEYYPKDIRLKLILDNHSAHISKETMKYLATRPNRFIYIHTPKHASWLNIIEVLFSKMARTVLKYIRVDSKKELKMRILKWVDEINETPVIFRWKNFNFKTY